MYWFPVSFPVHEILAISDMENIAISTIVGTSSHINFKLPKLLTFCKCCSRYHRSWKFYQYILDIVQNRFMFMVFNATFNNISVISLRSVLLVEEQWRI
jgi:hypothetical protein